MCTKYQPLTKDGWKEKWFLSPTSNSGWRWRTCLISYIQEILRKRFVRGEEPLLLVNANLVKPADLHVLLSTYQQREALEDMLKMFLGPQPQRSQCFVERWENMLHFREVKISKTKTSTLFLCVCGCCGRDDGASACSKVLIKRRLWKSVNNDVA